MDSARIVLDVVGLLSLLSGALAPFLPDGRSQRIARAVGLALPEALRAWKGHDR